MSSFSATQISKPTDEQAFERACLVLFRCLLNDPNVQLNAKRGQGQQGVDIFGFRNEDTARPAGIQCKLKADGKRLTEKEVRDELSKALEFEPRLREYFIVTTAADDGNLQRVVRELAVQQGNAGRQINISVWGWETLEQRISEHPDALDAFDPTFGPHAKRQSELLTKIGTEQITIIGHLVTIQNRITAGSSLVATNPGDMTEANNALEAALDAEIDGYRDTINNGKPTTALNLLDSLLKRVQHSSSGRILFRIKANIGYCHLATNDTKRAAHWLSEAYHHAPSEPKAVANYALAMLLRHNNREAFDFATVQLAPNPQNGWLAVYLVQAAARCPEVPDPITTIPEALRGLADVQAAHVDLLRIRGQIPAWWQEAKSAHSNHPDHKFLIQCAAEAELDELGRSDEIREGRISAALKQRIEEATSKLRTLWDQRRQTENPARPDGVAACCNLLAAYCALNKRGEALAIAKQAIVLVPDDEILLQRAAIAGLEAGDHSFVETLLPKISDTSDGVLIRFQYHAVKGDWPKLIEISKLTSIAPEHERAMMETMGRLARLMISDATVDRRHGLDEALKLAATDPRGSILVSKLAKDLQQNDIANQAYQQAVSLVTAQSHRASRAMVAWHAGQRDDWSIVTRLLDGYVDTGAPSPELNLLVTAFTNESPVRERANTFFRELPLSLHEQAFYATAYGYLQSKRGDLQEAEKWLSKAIENDPLTLSAWLGLFSVYVRQGRTNVISGRVKEIDLANIRGAPKERMALSHFLRDCGLFQAAAKFGYDTIQANRNDPEVALLYFGLFMSPHAEKMIPAATTVGKDTWVAIESDTDQLQLIIEDGLDRPAENLFNPTHPFVVPALGLKVGESFSLVKPFGPPETWRVIKIKHKYLHMLHEMEHFNIRFPDAQGLYKIATKEDDVTPLLDQVKALSERNRRVADLYIEQHFPLEIVTGLAGGEVTGLAGYVRSLGHDIATCQGNHPERAAAERIVLRPPSGGAVLDLYTAWIAATLKLLVPLRAIMGRLLVPRSVVDGFLEMERDASHAEGGESMSIGYHDGTFVRQIRTGEDATRIRRIVQERRLDLETNCEILPVEIPDNPTELARVILEKCGTHSLDSAFLAARDNRSLLSDDLYFRQYAEHACGAQSGMWLQVTLNIARHRRVFSRDAYAEAVIGLALCRHSHLTLDDLTLCDVLRVDDTDGLSNFTAVAEFIGTRTAEIVSHVSVASKFMVSAWALEVPDLRKQAASGVILTKLFRHRSADWREIVQTLRLEMIGRTRARDYLERWLQGHFLIA
jgi:cellulose synthase operon protein C